jgi:hypothetical protein
MSKRSLVIVSILLGLSGAPTFAQTAGDETTEPEAAAPKAPTKPAAPRKKRSSDEVNLGEGVDKKRFEAYLKERLQKINEHHKQRMDFFARETGTWNLFWNKVRDERRNFEIRITRQTLDLFESLASLDGRDHPMAVGDFEKMHGTLVKSFESQQRDKMTEFFYGRDARIKEFAAEQERERAEFLAEAQAGWSDNKPDQEPDGGRLIGHAVEACEARLMRGSLAIFPPFSDQVENGSCKSGRD